MNNVKERLSLEPHLRDGQLSMIIRPHDYSTRYTIKIIMCASFSSTQKCQVNVWNVTIYSLVMKWNISIEESHTVKIVIKRLRKEIQPDVASGDSTKRAISFSLSSNLFLEFSISRTQSHSTAFTKVLK